MSQMFMTIVAQLFDICRTIVETGFLQKLNQY